MLRLVAFLLLLLVGLPHASEAAEVSDLRLGAHPDKTRLVLDLSEDIPFKVFTLADPYRAVIDFPDLTWRKTVVGPPLPRGVVRAMRFGTFEAGTTRMVMDLSQPAVIKAAFVLPPRDDKGYRFVLDLQPVTAAVYRSEPAKRSVASAMPLPKALPAIASLHPRRRPSDGRPMIVIDPGHGGIDPGAITASGTYEKALMLDYAKALRETLRRSGRYRVTLTRDRDRFLKLRDRFEIAQKAGGQLFISLHANSHDSARIRGASVYTLSEKASDKEAARLAEKENAADILGGVDLAQHSDDVRDILLDLTWRETKNLSKQFADTMIEEIAKVSALLPNPHRFAGFAVLKSPSTPSVLFEVGYMTNPDELRKLRSRKYRDKMVGRMVKAIDRYFNWQQTVSRS